MNNSKYIIYINGFKWTITLVPSNLEVIREKNGNCVYEENTIYILKDLSYQNMQKVLIHELTHAYEYQFGLREIRERVSDSPHEDLAEFVSLYAQAIVNMSADFMEAYNETK